MGAYLDKPKTDKETEVGSMDLPPKTKLPFAVSSMQGWRKHMEDAHISMPNLENSYDVPPGTSLFAVFDGHGGKEVAKFCAKHFVETLVELESFKARAYREALIECFHKMDDLLRDPRYRPEIDRFAGIINFEEDANPAALAKSFDALDRSDETEKESEDGESKFRFSDDSEDQKNDLETLESERKASEEDSGVEAVEVEETETKEELEKKLIDRKESLNMLQQPNAKAELQKELKKEDKVDEGSKKDEEEVSEATEEVEAKDSSILDELERDDSPAVEVPQDLSEDMNNANDKGSLTRAEALNIMLRVLKLTKNAEEEEDAAEEPETPVKQPEPNLGLSLMDSDHTLPTHAGTTACVALIIEGKIYVANAGDSRAVLCRDKTAEALSFDHKPQQMRELTRIRNAGGWVTQAGRVCGNLNLSRCIGDLKYKQNDKVDKALQVITAEPDVKCVEVQEEDMFLVIACDGVWDIMTNEAIVGFVGKKMVEHARSLSESDERQSKTLQQTVENVFMECLCDDPVRAEGKGADNMTCIVACLRPLEDILQAYWS